MFEQGVKVSIGGCEHFLVFTLAALLEIKKKYGGLTEMAESFNGPTINEWDDAETKERKEIEQQKAQSNALDELPWLIATLATQGAWIENPKTEAISSTWIALHVLPKDLSSLFNSAMAAIAIGMGTEHADAGPRDPVLEELDRKNAEGAEGN